MTVARVVFRSPGVFQRYFKDDEATAKAKTPDGWVRSGDAGFIDSRGHLCIIDRAKDVGKLTNNALFAPKYLENRIKFYPEIKEAVAIGQGRDCVTMLINIDLASVGNWAERNSIVYASYQELAGHPQVYKMIERRIDELNLSLAREPRMVASQIKRFLILHKELDADDGEITRTKRCGVRLSQTAMRRSSMRSTTVQPARRSGPRVTFEDGRKGMLDGDVLVIDMKIHPPSGARRKGVNRVRG